MAVIMSKFMTVRERVRYVGWIESTGTQWIDTGYHVVRSTVIECDFQFTEVSGNAFLFRVVTPDYGFGWHSSGVFRSYGGSTGSFPATFSATERHTLKKLDTKCILDGNEISIGHHSAVPNYSLPIFAYNNEGAVTQNCKAKLYSFRIYEGDVLVRDYWPCYDPEGIACLYDKIEGKYYYNAGTGEFIAGGAA